MPEPVAIDRRDLDALFAALHRRGYDVVGPTVCDGAIVLDRIAAAADLPEGWTDRQEAGTYRLVRRADRALFGFTSGPHSLKRLQLAPDRVLWRARVDPQGALVDAAPPAGQEARAEGVAVIGARACDLHARDILARVLLGATPADPVEQRISQTLFVVAVQCAAAGATCFCASMGTGPEVTAGHDVLMTEIVDGAHHAFVARAASERGAAVLAEVPSRPPTEGERAAAAAAPARAAAQMGRALETEGLRELLYRNLEHPRWDDVASRCLTCGNCTMVCPTCFCTSVEDVPDLTGEHVERHERWDSCFTVDHSHIHGGAVRPTARARYRQWMTHKLASWQDQFGTTGCVGCGRCITWCPAAIDITEEARAIRVGDRGGDANDPG